MRGSSLQKCQPQVYAEYWTLHAQPPVKLAQEVEKSCTAISCRLLTLPIWNDFEDVGGMKEVYWNCRMSGYFESWAQKQGQGSSGGWGTSPDQVSRVPGIQVCFTEISCPCWILTDADGVNLVIGRNKEAAWIESAAANCADV